MRNVAEGAATQALAAKTCGVSLNTLKLKLARGRAGPSVLPASLQKPLGMRKAKAWNRKLSPSVLQHVEAAFSDHDHLYLDEALNLVHPHLDTKLNVKDISRACGELGLSKKLVRNWCTEGCAGCAECRLCGLEVDTLSRVGLCGDACDACVLACVWHTSPGTGLSTQTRQLWWVAGDDTGQCEQS